MRFAFWTLILVFFACSGAKTEKIEFPHTNQQIFHAAKTPLAEPEGELDLATALQLALQYHPRLQATNDWRELQTARRKAAHVMPNPQVEITGEDFMGSGAYRKADASQWTLLVSQVVELGGKARARARVADAQSAAENVQLELDRLELLSRVAMDFIRLLSLQQRRELLANIHERQLRLEKALAARVEAGKETQLQKQQVQIQVRLSELDLQELDRQIESARRILALYWGNEKPAFARVAGKFVPMRELPSMKLLRERMAAHPEVRLRQAAVAQWQAQKNLEAVAAVPDPALQAGVRAYTQDGDVAFVAGVSLPLPVWDRRQEVLRAADAQIRLARQDVLAVQQSLMRRLQERFDEAQRRMEEIERIESQLLPAVLSNIALFREGFSMGKFTLLEMLEAERAETELRLRLLDARTALQTALVELEFLTGVPILTQGKQP